MEVGNFQFKAKHVLFKEGQPASSVYKIENGEVLCVKIVRDRLVPVLLAGKGDIIGETAMIAGGKYNYSAITLQFTQTEPISQSKFQEEFRKSPAWMGKLIAIMASRFQHTANLMAENRVIHPSIFDESKFTPAFEIELKKLLGI